MTLHSYFTYLFCFRRSYDSNRWHYRSNNHYTNGYNTWRVKPQSNSIKVTLLIFLGIPVRGSIIITPPANIAGTTGTGARGQQRPRLASVILKASRGWREILKLVVWTWSPGTGTWRRWTRTAAARSSSVSCGPSRTAGDWRYID